LSTAELIIALAGIVFGATGFWTFLWGIIQRKAQKQDALIKMVLGLGHEKIIEVGLKYIERGYVTKDEYEDLEKYLYRPYKELGGNGTVERIMESVKKLPIKPIMQEG
jgi:hypothetical protein